MFSEHKQTGNFTVCWKKHLNLLDYITKNCWELSAMISEKFEISCLKWLKHRTCAPITPSVASENFMFFSSLIFVSGNLALKSKEVKQQQQQQQQN